MAKAKEKAAPPKRAPRTAPTFNTLADDDDDVEDAPAKKSAAEAAADEEDDDAPKPAKKKAPAKDDVDDLLDDGPPPPKKKEGEKPKQKPVLVVDLEKDRKLTAKDKARLSGWHGKQKGKMLDGFFARQATEARKKFGHGAVYLGSESETLVLGIPTPALAFEYVICQDCFPLGLVLQIVAKHGVGKSGLLAEFGRWFNACDGGMVLCENETKFNEYWYTSIMGHEAYNRVPLYRCKSVEDWQRKLTFAMKQMQADMVGTKDAPGPGRTFPVLFGVDSIMGKMSEENQEKILGKVGKKGKLGTTGEGFAQARSFPIEAGSITKYMRTIPQVMDSWPFALVLINHLRVKTDDMGNPERNKTGGEQVNFQESFELELKKVGGHAKKISAADFEGIPLQLSCEKNSFGPTGRKANIRILWRHEEDENTGETVQRSIWDWDWSTVHLLNHLLRGENASTYLRARLKKMDFHLECPSTSDIDNTAWSATLGMKEKDAVPWQEMGALLRENDEVMSGLRDALCISRRARLKGDYLKQRDKLAEEMP